MEAGYKSSPLSLPFYNQDLGEIIIDWEHNIESNVHVSFTI
jgi:hypothetical protein